MFSSLRKTAVKRRCIASIIAPLFLLTFIVFLEQMAGAAVVGSPIHNPATGSDYYVLTPNTWPDAETEAVSLGGHLVTINDSEENTFIVNNIIEGAYDYDPLWIGISGSGIDAFNWTSGEPMTYYAWYWGETTDAGYGAINLPYVIGWSGMHNWWDTADYFGSGPYYGIAEVVPEPSTQALLAIAAAALLVWRRMR